MNHANVFALKDKNYERKYDCKPNAPRAGVSTDHGPLVRNPLNHRSKMGEPGPVRNSSVPERQS